MLKWRKAAAFLGLALSASAANANIITIDNYTLNATDPVSAGNATFGWQSFTPNVGGPGSGDTVAANSPMLTVVYLETISFAGRTSTGGATGPLFLNIYSGTGTSGTLIGSSTNSITVNGAGDNNKLTWNFDDIALNSSTTYSIAASSSQGGAVATAGFRVEATDGDTGSTGAQSSYTGGSAAGPTGTAVAFDTRFSATLNTVPEPASAGLIGLSGLLLLARRRRA
jgi:hypothetical protein